MADATIVTVNGLTKERMLEIEGESVVSGHIDGSGHLILVRHDGVEVDAGLIPPGPQGPPGSITVSAAGGALSGNYPNPGLANNYITEGKIADTNKDGESNVPSMRTLGTGVHQAAAGDHNHGDTGWVNLTVVAGDPPFGTAGIVYAQYRKIGQMVHVRLRKDQTGTVDRSGTPGGNFPNVKVLGTGSVPTIACPKDHAVQGSASIIDSPAGVELNPDGSVVWTGGFARNYPSGSSMIADFVFFTSN